MDTKCNYSCSKHSTPCIRPKNHAGLHICAIGCKGGNDYGMFGGEDGEPLKFVKMEKEK
jgi:hypothetical protein